MTHRFFRAASEVYESIRSQVDAAWGYPTEHTLTSIPPAAEQIKDAAGHCLIGVKAEWTTWEPVATLLPQLIAFGDVEELTEQEYWAAMPVPE